MSLEACWSLLSCSEPISYEPLLHTHKCEHLTRPAGLFSLSSGVINIQQCIHAHGRGLCWSQRCSQSAEALRGRAGMWTTNLANCCSLSYYFWVTPPWQKRDQLITSPLATAPLSHTSSTCRFWLQFYLRTSISHSLSSSVTSPKALLPLSYLCYLSAPPLTTRSPPPSI